MKTKREKGGERPVKKTTLYFDPDFHKRLKILAIEEDLSMTALIEKAIELYKTQKNRKGGKQYG